jgi:choline kinase
VIDAIADDFRRSEEFEVKAVLLAAGRGRRLGVNEPKCMIQVAGRSLLERHLDHLGAAGITHLTVVVGYLAPQLQTALRIVQDARRAMGTPLPFPVETIHNDLYENGSIVSLQKAAHQLEEGGIWMDADVFYPGKLLKKLVDSPHNNCVLLDGKSTEQGEEMMLGVQGGRVRRIARSVGPDWDLVGESVGFFKVGADGAHAMRTVLDAEVEAGRLDQEYEAALDRAFDSVAFGFERVDELPWTEIDFPDDIDKAAELARTVDHPDRQ